jgi:hypothetical protein
MWLVDDGVRVSSTVDSTAIEKRIESPDESSFSLDESHPLEMAHY